MARIAKYLALLPVLLSTVSVAQPPTAEAFLKAIYAHYVGDDRTTAKGIFLDKPREIRRYFAPELANLIIADEAAAARRNEVPALDGDPFVDAQDWGITNLSIHIDSETASAAGATVRFDNMKEPEVIRIALVRTRRGWRVADIVWPKGEGSLRALYRANK